MPESTGKAEQWSFLSVILSSRVCQVVLHANSGIPCFLSWGTHWRFGRGDNIGLRNEGEVRVLGQGCVLV